MNRLRADERAMAKIQSGITASQSPSGPEAVFIRFPNRTRPLTGCIAGEVFYVFVNGDTAICPYLVFAARIPETQHTPEEFIVSGVRLVGGSERIFERGDGAGIQILLADWTRTTSTSGISQARTGPAAHAQ